VSVAERWREIRGRIGEAAARAGRDPAEVTVVAAAKTIPAATVAEAIAAGVRDVGENYVQEAAAKRGAVGVPVRWHLIGRLQRNKAARALGIFEWIHTLDSVALAEALERAAVRAGRTARCLVQVNLGGEATKGGIPVDELESLCTAVAGRRGLQVEGLMTVPPPAADAEENRRHFAHLRELLERVARLRLPGVQPKELSMGMSADFEVAVEEGATFVRIGTALFGPREPKR
jgi:PLP dependent protein